MSATAPLLATKLYIPRPQPSLAPRPRLTARLAESLTCPLTLISASAGFGKTTLLSEWIADLRLRISDGEVAWLSLDAGDNDPIRFWSYFIAALQTVKTGLGADVSPLLHSPQPPSIESILTPLLNDLAAIPDDFALILDDYHVIDSPALHDGLTFLIDHLPPHAHVIVTSRADPSLPLARLRARGQLLEFRADDLRFTLDEAVAFLNQAMGLGLSALDVAALEERTEGWIAGLQLAALSMQGRGAERISGFIAAFTGSNRYIVDYLAEEVLQRQPTDIQSFLWQTSILERLSGPLCNAVTAQTQAQAILERLERANLFLIPLDSDRQWYRYHHLFAEVLRSHLRQTQPALVPELHRRASVWYEQHRFAPDAVRHALAASDSERAARLIEETGESLFKRGEHATLQGWIDALPEETVRARPQLAVFRARIFVILSQLDSAEQWLRDAERGTGAEAALLTESILSEVAALRANIAIYRNDLPGAIALAHQALERMPADNMRLRGEVMQYLGGAYGLGGDFVKSSQAYAEASRLAGAAGDVNTAVYAMFNQGAIQDAQGQLRRAAETYRRCLELAEERGVGRMPITALIQRDLAELSYQWNDLEAATAQISEAIARSERGALPRVLVVSYITLARILNAQGDGARALETILKAEQMVQERSLPARHAGMVAAYKIRLWLAQGNLDGASAWAQTSGLGVDDRLDYLHEIEHVALARVLVARGEVDRAVRFLERLRQAAEAEGRMSDVIPIMALEAVAWQGIQPTGTVQARAVLEQALALAEPEGYIRPFVDEGEPMGLLIADCRLQIEKRARSVDTEHSRRLLTYADRLLAAFGDSSTAPQPSEIGHPPSAIGNLIEPLTEREREVLRLVAEGLSDRQIAEQMTVVVGTVKRHLNNVYGKLGVHSRTQALARAKDLALL